MQRSVILVVCTVILRQNFIQRNLHRKDTKLNPLLEIKLNAIKKRSAARNKVRDDRFSYDTKTSRPTIAPTITNPPTTPPSSNISTTTTYSTTTTSFEPTSFEPTGDILIFGHFGSRDTTAGLFFGLQKAKLIYIKANDTWPYCETTADCFSYQDSGIQEMCNFDFDYDYYNNSYSLNVYSGYCEPCPGETDQDCFDRFNHGFNITDFGDIYGDGFWRDIYLTNECLNNCVNVTNYG